MRIHICNCMLLLFESRQMQHRKQLTGRAVAAANEELWIGRTSTAVKGELYWWRLLLFMLVGCRLLMFMVELNFVQRSGIHT